MQIPTIPTLVVSFDHIEAEHAFLLTQVATDYDLAYIGACIAHGRPWRAMLMIRTLLRGMPLQDAKDLYKYLRDFVNAGGQGA